LNKHNLKIDWASHEAAKFACVNWHYSKCIPKSKLVKIGVWESNIYIGCIIYGVGANNNLVNPYGLKSDQGCELVRIALKEHSSPVSRIMAISFNFLKQHCPQLRLIVSFADTSQGHHGGIYQATNWVYTGKSPDSKFPIIKGRETHPRTLSLMVKSGKIKRSDVKFILKKGKHRYLMPLDKEIKKQIETLAKPYPKRGLIEEQQIPSADGGASPTSTLHIEEPNNG
jgi:hypothetical protein|tara:strand:+ start:161 stop:841 length:681 start_codon:yes stop_codon:yes gene_type:complete